MENPLGIHGKPVWNPYNQWSSIAVLYIYIYIYMYLYECIHMSPSPYIKNIYIGIFREFMVSPLGILMTFDKNSMKLTITH